MNRSSLLLFTAIISSCAAFLLCATPAAAADGYSMLFITGPWITLASFPLFLLEGWILRFRLRVSLGQAMAVSAINKFLSVVAVVPLTWYVLFLIQKAFGGTTLYGHETLMQKVIAVTLQAPVLPPYTSEMRWMIPAASTYLLIMYGIASFFVECAVGLKFFKGMPRKKILGAFFLANLACITIMALYGLIPLMVEIAKRTS